MKGVLFLLVIGLGLIGLTGCATVPRDYTYVEEVIYYPLPTPPPPEYYYPPASPTPPIYNPPSYTTRPTKERQPERPKESYNQRDPLRGHGNRGNEERKTEGRK